MNLRDIIANLFARHALQQAAAQGAPPQQQSIPVSQGNSFTQMQMAQMAEQQAAEERKRKLQELFAKGLFTGPVQR